MYLDGNICKLLKVCLPGYVRLYNNTCIEKCPDNEIRVGNECKKCTRRQRKNEKYNKWIEMFINIKKLDTPVIYLYPKETMDVSVQLNIKNSKFITIYPKFNGKNTWNVKA